MTDMVEPPSTTFASFRMAKVREPRRPSIDHIPFALSSTRICRNCEFYDDGTGERRTAASGDCLNTFAPRFQTKPGETCERFFRNSIDPKAQV